MVDTLIFVFIQPLLYAVITGWLVGMYLMWSLARRQFLGVNQAMNLFCLSLLGGWLGATAAQAIGYLIQGYSLDMLWFLPHPTSWPLLVGWVGLWLTASWYLKRIRYPYWKMLDMLAIGLLPLVVGLLVSWAIRLPHPVTIGLAIASVIVAVGLGLLYRRISRLGVVFNVLWVAIFSAAIVARLMAPSWQRPDSIVEWLPDAIGVVAGMTLLILRLSGKSRQMVQDIPRGVSQGFRDTFGRSLAKQPSNKGGLSDNGGAHE